MIPLSIERMFDQMEIDAVRVLEVAEALIADEEAWTQRENARDRMGMRTRATDPDATCWCMAGALIMAAALLNGGPAAAGVGRWQDALMTAEGAVDAAVVEITGDEYHSIVLYNDSRGRQHRDAVTAIGRARTTLARKHPALQAA